MPREFSPLNKKEVSKTSPSAPLCSRDLKRSPSLILSPSTENTFLLPSQSFCENKSIEGIHKIKTNDNLSLAYKNNLETITKTNYTANNDNTRNIFQQPQLKAALEIPVAKRLNSEYIRRVAKAVNVLRNRSFDKRDQRYKLLLRILLDRLKENVSWLENFEGRKNIDAILNSIDTLTDEEAKQVSSQIKAYKLLVKSQLCDASLRLAIEGVDLSPRCWAIPTENQLNIDFNLKFPVKIFSEKYRLIQKYAEEKNQKLQPEKLKDPESLSLQAVELQSKIWNEIVETYYKSESSFNDKQLLRKYKNYYMKETRLVEKLEKQIAFEMSKIQKVHRSGFINIVLSGVREFKDFHRQVVRQIRKYHENIESEKKKTSILKEKERMRALMEDNEEEYRKLIDEKKDTRLLYLLNQTDSYIEKFSNLLQVRKAHRRKALQADQSVNDALEDEEPGGASPSEASYYAIAHSREELIERQPSLLVSGTLKHYQLKGLEWLVSLYNNGLNGILADEMGLGKTIQTIAFLAYLIEHKNVAGPFLVIVPLSTLDNWSIEFAKWAPSIVLVKYRGKPQDRKALHGQILAQNFNVLLTTYEFTIKDRTLLSKLPWFYAVVDEGHRIKNKESKLTETLTNKYKIEHRLLLTGTPLQNSLPELWSLMNFLLPDIFSSSLTFDEWFSIPFDHVAEVPALNREETVLVIRRLHKILRPFLLRRLKSEVASELPEKVEYLIKVPMSALQKALHSQIQRGVLLSKTGQQSGEFKARHISNTLMQLRKVCNHPFLFPEVEREMACMNAEGDVLCRVCGKFQLLDHLLKKLLFFRHRTLIFCQMTQLMTILEDFLLSRGIKYLRLDGTTKSEERGKLLETFNTPGSEYDVFLLSTRAGGLGLNLQSADTVIIYDSDWNPHQDLQAQDRAHRLGQKKEVRVLRLVTVNSVEEKILEAAERKLLMDAKVIQAGRFDNKTTAEERKQLLENLVNMDVPAEMDNDENAENPTHSHEAINEMIARTEAELEHFKKMDEDIFKRSRCELLQLDEVPHVYRRNFIKAADQFEALDLTMAHGRGQRDRLARSVDEQPSSMLCLKILKKHKKERQHKAIGPFTRYLKKILSVVYKHKEENRRVSDLFVKIPSKRDYPDYAAIVKNPIALKPMKNKILEGKYKSVKDFEQDMLLMADNAKLYNGADSFVYRDALKLLGVFYKTLELLKPYEAKLYKRVHEEIREASGVEEKNKRKKVKTSAVELLENL